MERESEKGERERGMLSSVCALVLKQVHTIADAYDGTINEVGLLTQCGGVMSGAPGDSE